MDYQFVDVISSVLGLNNFSPEFVKVMGNKKMYRFCAKSDKHIEHYLKTVYGNKYDEDMCNVVFLIKEHGYVP